MAFQPDAMQGYLDYLKQLPEHLTPMTLEDYESATRRMWSSNHQIRADLRREFSGNGPGSGQEASAKERPALRLVGRG